MHQKPLRRRGILVATGTAVAALLLSGCVASDRDGGGEAAGDVDTTFIFAASSDPASLAPAFAQDGETFRVSRQMFTPLCQR